MPENEHGNPDSVSDEIFSFEVTEPIWFDTGDYIEFESVLAVPILSADKFPSQGYFDGTLLALYVGTRQRGAFLGSAMIVAPGVAIGARHVIDEHVSQLRSGEIGITGFGLGENARGGVWDIKHIMTDPSHDVAIFSLIRRSAVPKNKKFKQATLSTRLPAIGEAVMIAGFKPSKEVFEAQEGSGLAFAGNIWGSVGIVADHYLSGRDRIMLPWPSFRVEVGSWGAMSGGPVFDKDGAVVGVLCSAMGTEGDGYSCVSMLHPALGMPFQTSWPNALYKDVETLLGIPSRLCCIKGREAVVLDQGDNGIITWTYNSWT